MSARAGIVVTGTEVLTGRVQDRNGPWLAERLLELGIELAHITICGDRPADMEAQLRFLAGQGVDVIVTSGGLGPTADDLTAEVVGRFQGRDMVLDEELERRIARRIREDCSPRHVPSEIQAIAEVPRTLSGKVLEVPVKRILMGTPPDQAASRDSLTNPAALDAFVELSARG